VFDEVWGGFFRSFNTAPGDLTRFSDGLGDIWKLDRVSLKPYASCRGVHSSVDALDIILTETGRDPQDIADVAVRLSEMLMGMCGCSPIDRLAGAQMSLPYAIAARIVFGHAGLGAYAEAKRHDSALHAMIGQISLAPDPAMKPLDEPFVRVRFKDGMSFERMVSPPTGSPLRPMTPAAIDAKFGSLAAMALPDDRIDALRTMIDQLDHLDDSRQLASLLARTDPEAGIFR
jgi:2-methylcitrate dehydratase PrpD